MGLNARKPVLRGLQTSKAQTSLRFPQSDQHLCYSLIEKYHIQTYYNFWLVSVAEETGLSLTSSEMPRQVLSRGGPYENILVHKNKYLSATSTS